MYERRKIKRINKTIEVIVSSDSREEGKAETLATCKNISIGGICLELRNSYRQGEQLYLRLFNKVFDDFVDARCEVAWIKSLEKNNLFTVGLKFQSMTEAQFERLLQF